MPSITIHIAIASSYYKKHSEEIKELSEFINGSIYADIAKVDKNISHYGIWNRNNAYIDFKKFLNDEKVDMSTDFWKGYFLHLIADYYFYNYLFKAEYALAVSAEDTLYNDYYYINKDLIEEYELEIRDDVKQMMTPRDGVTKYLDINKIKKFINNISDIKISEYIKIANEDSFNDSCIIKMM